MGDLALLNGLGALTMWDTLQNALVVRTVPKKLRCHTSSCGGLAVWFELCMYEYSRTCVQTSDCSIWAC